MTDEKWEEHCEKYGPAWEAYNFVLNAVCGVGIPIDSMPAEHIMLSHYCNHKLVDGCESPRLRAVDKTSDKPENGNVYFIECTKCGKKFQSEMYSFKDITDVKIELRERE